MPRSRHAILTVVGSGIGFCSLVAQEKPNIILFLVDDMGLMDTSVPFVADDGGQPLGKPLNDWYRTPNMERLADRGIRFSTFYALSVSSPSRTTILTGHNSTRHRTTTWIRPTENNRTPFGPPRWNWDGLTGSDVVYPELLRRDGYKTIHVGKAHFGRRGSEGEDPVNLGFEVNIAGSAIGEPGSYYGENDYGWTVGRRENAVPGLERYHGSNTFLTEALTREACREIAQAVGEGRPFYLNMAHYAVHNPFEPDPRFIDNYNGDPSKSEQARAFASLIEGMDKSLGDIMDKLGELGVAQNTLILLLGDNGSDAPLGEAADYGSSAPFRGKKGSEYEGGVRVPFIASWACPDPSNPLQQRLPIAAGTIQTQIATVMDIFPTILSVAHVASPAGYTVDGSDLNLMFAGRRDENHSDEFLLHFPHEHRGSYFTTFRQGDWKLIYDYHPENPSRPGYRLYNLANDPYEAFDLASEEPQRVREMTSAMILRLDNDGALYPVTADGQEIRPVVPACTGIGSDVPARSSE